MYMVRNYNRFLIGTREAPKVEDFFIHRFKSDVKKLIRFETRQEAQAYLDAHPKLFADWGEPWIVTFYPEVWT